MQSNIAGRAAALLLALATLGFVVVQACNPGQTRAGPEGSPAAIAPEPTGATSQATLPGPIPAAASASASAPPAAAAGVAEPPADWPLMGASKSGPAFQPRQLQQQTAAPKNSAAPQQNAAPQNQNAAPKAP
jgi:hypothetical protein